MKSFIFIIFVITLSCNNNNRISKTKKISLENKVKHILTSFNHKKFIVDSFYDENSICLFDPKQSKLQNYNIKTKKIDNTYSYKLFDNVFDVLARENKLYFITGNETTLNTFVYKEGELIDTISERCVHDENQGLLLCSEEEIEKSSSRLFMINTKSKNETIIKTRGNSGVFISEDELLITIINENGSSILVKYHLKFEKAEELSKFRESLLCLKYDKTKNILYLKADGDNGIFEYNIAKNKIRKIYNGHVYTSMIDLKYRRLFITTYDNELIRINLP